MDSGRSCGVQAMLIIIQIPFNKSVFCIMITAFIDSQMAIWLSMFYIFQIIAIIQIEWLTWVGHSEPWWWRHDIAPGISPGFMTVAIWITGQQVGQSEDVADEPNQHDC